MESQQSSTSIAGQSEKNFVEPSKQVEDHCLKKRRNKIILMVFIILALVGIGLGVGLSFYLRPRVTNVQPSQQISFGSQGTVSMTPMTIVDKNLFSPDVEVNIIKTEALNPRKRLLQEQGSQDFTVSASLDLQGIIVKASGSNGIELIVDPIALSDYILKEYPQTARFLQNDEVGMNEEDWSSFQTDLNQAVSQELNGNHPVEVEISSYKSFQMNDKSNQFEIVSSPSRLLAQKRILFFKRIFKKVTKVIKAVVKPVVEVIRTSAPYIGAVVGAGVGFVFGGPVGAFQGAKTGYMIGSIAQVVVKGCIPKNTLDIKCDLNYLSKEATKMGATYAFGKVTGLSSWNPFVK